MSSVRAFQDLDFFSRHNLNGYGFHSMTSHTLPMFLEEERHRFSANTIQSHLHVSMLPETFSTSEIFRYSTLVFQCLQTLHSFTKTTRPSIGAMVSGTVSYLIFNGNLFFSHFLSSLFEMKRNQKYTKI